MLFYIGILLGLLTAILQGVDTYLNKDLMNNVTAYEHSAYRIIFVIPYFIIAALLNWNFNIDAIPYLLIFGLIESLNIVFHQLSIKSLNPVHNEMLSKSNVIFVYIFSIILVEESIKTSGIISIVLFALGMLMTIDFSNIKHMGLKGDIFELLSVILRAIKPFILREILLSGNISNEVLNLMSMIIAVIVILITFRPKLDFKGINIKLYSIQSLIVGSNMLALGYSVLYAGPILSSMLNSLSMFFVMILMYLFKHKKTNALTILGAIIIMASIFIEAIY